MKLYSTRSFIWHQVSHFLEKVRATKTWQIKGVSLNPFKVFFDYENKVFQLMSAGASLERFGEGFQEVKIVQTLF